MKHYQKVVIFSTCEKSVENLSIFKENPNFYERNKMEICETLFKKEFLNFAKYLKKLYLNKQIGKNIKEYDKLKILMTYLKNKYTSIFLITFSLFNSQRHLYHFIKYYFVFFLLVF